MQERNSCNIELSISIKRTEQITLQKILFHWERGKYKLALQPE